MVIGISALAVGFGIVWHIWWLAVVGLLSVVVTIIVRSMDEDTEYTIPASVVKKMDQKFRAEGGIR